MKGRPIKVSHQPSATLTLTVKQSSSACCPTRHVLKGVQWGHVNNMKVSRNISSPAYPNFCVGSRARAKHSHIPKNFPPPSLLTGIATLLIVTVPQSQPIMASELGASAMQHAKI